MSEVLDLAAAVSDKQFAQQAIGKMANDASLHEIAERLAFLEGVRAAARELDEGKGIPAEEVFRDLEKWLAR